MTIDLNPLLGRSFKCRNNVERPAKPEDSQQYKEQDRQDKSGLDESLAGILFKIIKAMRVH